LYLLVIPNPKSYALKVEAMVDFLLALALIRSDSFSIQLGVAFVPPIFSFVLLPLH
jgi:hypothetical protein